MPYFEKTSKNPIFGGTPENPKFPKYPILGGLGQVRIPPRKPRNLGGVQNNPGLSTLCAGFHRCAGCLINTPNGTPKCRVFPTPKLLSRKCHEFLYPKLLSRKCHELFCHEIVVTKLLSRKCHELNLKKKK